MAYDLDFEQDYFNFKVDKITGRPTDEEHSHFPDEWLDEDEA